MKIALCFSGIPRFYDRLDLSDYGEHDLYTFIHSWTDRPNSSNCLEKLYPNSKALNYIADSRLIECIKPTNYKLESLKYKNYYFNHLYSKFRNCEGEARQSVLPMYYGIRESVKLALDSQINFDIIVRTRFDIRWLQPLRFELNDALNIPDQFHYMGICDQFCYAEPNLMESYSKAFDYLESCPDIQLNPEIVLRDFIHQNNIKTNMFGDEFILLR